MFPHHRGGGGDDGGDPLTRHNYYNYVNIIIRYESRDRSRRYIPTVFIVVILYIRKPRVARAYVAAAHTRIYIDIILLGVIMVLRRGEDDDNMSIRPL